MVNTLPKPPPSMTVADFLAWPGDGTGRKFQLVDGEVRAMSPASAAHAVIQADLASELRLAHSTHLLAELLRRGPDGHWPEETEKIGPGGVLSFESIGFSCPSSEIYIETPLADAPTT